MDACLHCYDSGQVPGNDDRQSERPPGKRKKKGNENETLPIYSNEWE